MYYYIMIAPILALPLLYSVPQSSLPRNLTYALSLDLGNSTLPALLSKTNPQALQMFDLGLRLYHVFWFDLAETAFGQSVKWDSNFAMAYWGQAMSQKYPIWHTEYLNKASHILESIPASAPRNAVESSLIDATKHYLDPSRPTAARELDYSVAIKKIQDSYPNDADIGALYALSLLGLACTSNDAAEKSRMVTLQLLKKFPNHRGLLHYSTHSHDDPSHASQALDESIRLAKLTPGSSHATHMQSHLFVNLGDWNKVLESNRMALKAADSYCSAIGGGIDCDFDNKYHALEWHHYSLLQLRDPSSIADVKRIIVASDTNKLYSDWRYRMQARQQAVQPTVKIFSSVDVSELKGTNAFWDAYTESGALVAQALHRSATHKQIPDLTSRFKSLLNTTITMKYVNTQVSIDSMQYMGLRLLSLNDKSGLDWLKRAADAEEHNAKDADSPTLPIVPAMETYAVHLKMFGKVKECDMILKVSDTHWSHRVSPLLPMH